MRAISDVPLKDAHLYQPRLLPPLQHLDVILSPSSSSCARPKIPHRRLVLHLMLLSSTRQGRVTGSTSDLPGG